MIDGDRVTFADEKAIVLKPEYHYDLKAYSQGYHCKVNEFVVRKLGAATRASIRIPTSGSNLDHQFSALELRRFKLFAQNFLPAEPLVK